MTEHTETTLSAAILKTWPFNAPRPRYVTALQVRNGAGFSASRTLDAIVLDTWPSEGLMLHGLEIKCSKDDFRRELQNLGKAEGFLGYLDLFSIVAPPGIVDLALLPPKWGLYCPTENGELRARRRPLDLQTKDARLTMDRSLVAAFARALVDRSLSREGLKAEYDRGYDLGKKLAEADAASDQRRLEELKKTVADFEEASGIRLRDWNAGKLGAAVEFIMRGGIEQRIAYAGNIRDMARRLIQLADEMDTVSAGMQSLEAQRPD
jgi:hypothetical protein